MRTRQDARCKGYGQGTAEVLLLTVQYGGGTQEVPVVGTVAIRNEGVRDGRRGVWKARGP